MNSSLTIDLLDAFQSLKQTVEEFGEAVMADAGANVWLPEPFDKEPKKHRLVAKTLTGLWYMDREDPVPPSGIFCAGAAVLEAADAVNAAKAAFYQKVQLIRKSFPDSKFPSSDLLWKAIAKRDPELQTMMKTVGIERADLTLCYRKIQVLPATLNSISWTWARSHRYVKRLSYKEAERFIKKNASQGLLPVALDRLAGLPPGTPLAALKHKPPQLRANLVWEADETVYRKAIVTSSIVLHPSTRMPRIRWPLPLSEQAEPNRLSRSDDAIEAEPFIQGLPLHLYWRSGKNEREGRV